MGTENKLLTGAWDKRLCLYTADWSYDGDACVAGKSVTNRPSPSLSPSSSKDSPLLTSSPECLASTSIQGIARAASAVSRTLILFVAVRDFRLFMAGLALGEESSSLWERRRRRRFCEGGGGRRGDEESDARAMTGRLLAWPAARTGKDGGGATGEEEPSGKRGGGIAGGGISRLDIGGTLGRIGELAKTMGDPFSGSESSITMASDPWDPNVRGRGPATGLLATSPASSESANNQARLSSASRSFVLGAVSRSEASLLGAELPKYGSGAITTSAGATDEELGGDGE